jgi:HSP20 family protein
MAIVKKSDGYFPSIPSLIDSFFSRDLMDWNNSNFSSTNTTLPAVNIKENDDRYEIEVAAPGMKKGDFQIKLDNNQLTISSENKTENEEKDSDGNYFRREFSYQSFKRTFTLPEHEIEGDKITAVYTDGILKVYLPKKEEVKPKPAREIRIS